MGSVKPSHAQIPPQRGESGASSMTQARVDAQFRALAARREYERGVARLAAEPVTPPAQRGSAE